MTTAHPGSDVETPAKRGWFTVATLTALFAMSFVDRFILSLLAVPVSHDLQLDDTQMSLLLGAGFAITYALSGVPIAHLLDRGNRRLIIACGVTFWSISTIAAGFTDSFGALAVTRAGVALGEAVMAPAAISIIADIFPPGRRALPVAVFTSVAGLMVHGSLIVGAAALGLATRLQPYTGLAPWRGTLVMLGTPGLILTLVLLLGTREPVRRAHAPGEAEGSSFKDFATYLWAKRAFYVPFYLGASMLVMYSYASLAWLPTLLTRAHGLQPAEAGYILGMVFVPTAFAGAFAYPALAAWLERRGQVYGIVIAFLTAAIVATPFLILAPIAIGLPALLAQFVLVVFSLSTSATLSPLAMQTYGPARMRARLLAVSLLCSSMIGFAVGPTAVARLAKAWPGDPNALGHGLSALGFISGPGAIFFFALCLWGSRRTVAGGRSAT